MKFAAFLLLAVCLAGLIYWIKRMSDAAGGIAGANTAGPQVDPDDWLDAQKLTIATASQSDERAARLLTMKGSEDVSSLLVRPKPSPEERSDYGPREAVEWVIDITGRQSAVFKRSQILAVFDRAWREKNSWPMIYGRGAADQKWTYVSADDVPDDYDRLALGIDFSPRSGVALTETGLNEVALAADVAAKRLGAISTKARLPVKAALTHAQKLTALRREFESARAMVVLAAPEGKTFDGKAIWDVMMCLGLHWGDMDEFHWENENQSIGDDHLFSVSSGTAPGYFLPEEIAAGRVHVGSLVFDFSIPRSANPNIVLQGMLEAATYAQKRLGGELVDGEGAELNASVLKKQVADISARLTEAGFPPGQDATMRLF